MGAAEHVEDGYGVGGGDEGAKEERTNGGELDAEQAESEAQKHSDEDGGERGGGDGEGEDGDFFLGELGKIELKRAGEEQEGEHAVEDDFVEIERGDEALGGVMELRNDVAGGDEEHGRGERQDDSADGAGQAQDAVADEAEDRPGRDDQAQQSEGGRHMNYEMAARRG